MLSRMRSGRPKSSPSPSDSPSSCSVAMTFPEHRLRTEWKSSSSLAASLASPSSSSSYGGAEGWIWDEKEKRREKLNSYNLQRLPAEPFASKEGYFLKSNNQAQTSWKRRFFIVRGGLLIFFKEDPASQPAGIATLPQGVIPLEGCDVSLPMDFHKSFSFKGRKGVSGYELKLSHSSRGSHILVFPTASERLEWSNFLSKYILNSFFSDRFKWANKLFELEKRPLHCWYRSMGHSASKKYLYIDWFSKDCANWCLRISAVKLHRIRLEDGSVAFDSTTNSFLTTLPLHLVAKVGLIESSPKDLDKELRHSDTPPIRQSRTPLPRKPTFDQNEEVFSGDEDFSTASDKPREDLILEVQVFLSPSTAAQHSTDQSVSGVESHHFSAMNGNSSSLRQWSEALQAALKLQENNVAAMQSSSTSKPRPTLLSTGRSSSSRSVRELQELMKQERERPSEEEQSSQRLYWRGDFLDERDQLDDSLKCLETLSVAAESGSEVELGDQDISFVKTSRRSSAALRPASLSAVNDPPCSPSTSGAGAQQAAATSKINNNNDDNNQNTDDHDKNVTCRSNAPSNGNEERGQESEASASSCRGRVLVTRKGREQQGQNRAAQDEEPTRRRTFSRQFFNSMNSRRKRRLSSSVDSSPQKYHPDQLDYDQLDYDNDYHGNSNNNDNHDPSHVNPSHGHEGDEHEDEQRTLEVEYMPHTRRGVKKVSFELEVSPLGLLCRRGGGSKPSEERCVPLDDCLSAEVDLRGTGLMRLRLRLKSSGECFAVSWVVRSVAGREAAEVWLQRLGRLKRKRLDEFSMRQLL